MKILKGDTVTITVGKDKGRSGEVLAAFPKIDPQKGQKTPS